MPVLFHRHFCLGTLIYGAGVIALVGLFATYVFFQARHIIDGPMIVLTDDPPAVVHEPTVHLAGIAENIVSLSLNDRTIYTDDHGRFNERVVVPVGHTTLTFLATDRYGRTEVLERKYVRLIESL